MIFLNEFIIILEKINKKIENKKNKNNKLNN